MADIRKQGSDFAKLLVGISSEERRRCNELNRRKAMQQHKAFQEKFKSGQCYFCNEALDSFRRDKSCRHWLLKPPGFGKEHFELVTKEHSLAALEDYLRWVANEGAFAKNINDFADEGTGKLVELTIKHKNLEWSFSCGLNDLTGHESGAEASKQPHYHFQMYVDGCPFIRYNEFHIALTTEDIGFLEYMRSHPGKVRRCIAGGAGMNEVLNESTLEQVVAVGRSGLAEDENETAPIKLDTFVVAEPGKEIKGEDIMRLIQAARDEGVTMASKLRQLQDATVQIIVSPGPGVVEQAVRFGRKRRRKKRKW